MNLRRFIFVLCVGASSVSLADQLTPIVVQAEMVHLRKSEQREWASFPQQAKAKQLDIKFQAAKNDAEWTLSLRQQNVKHGWQIRLNDVSIGKLVRDENDLRTDFPIPANLLVDGDNQLQILQTGREAPDDIRVGDLRIQAMSRDQLRNAAAMQIIVTDELDKPVPSRITVVDEAGTLVPIGTKSGDGLAVRQGVVYSINATTSFGVAPGVYRVYASRGLEYCVAESVITAHAGDLAKRTLVLKRTVDTHGWVACDTHVHTVTHSGHGDCSVEERMVTLAGEGVELPIATDHNKHIDYRPVAKTIGVVPYFTPVIGNEVTTKKGHFNIFPATSEAELPNHKQEDWGLLMDDIFSTPDVRVAILNHARDIHSDFRPFSPRHHISLTGENLGGRTQRFNAMEIINSGAVQTDATELFFDWCGLINSGLSVTPVGCSDSHDVSRYIVGQGRTYIRSADTAPHTIDIDEATQAFVKGRVVVSYGLFLDLHVNETARPGDTLSLADDKDLTVTATVQGPAWTKADSIKLYVCGKERFRSAIPENSAIAPGVKGQVTWRIPRSELSQDVWLTATAHGPGIEAPHWPTALPYQPTSPAFASFVFSSTGPIRIDADGDKTFTSPAQYAQRIVDESDGDVSVLVAKLDGYHRAVVHQAAAKWRQTGGDLAEAQASAKGNVAKALAEYRKAWRASTIARLENVE